LAVIWPFFMSLNVSLSLENFLRHFLYAIIAFPIGGLLFGLFLSRAVPNRENDFVNSKLYFAFLFGVLFMMIMIILCHYIK